MKSNFNNRCVPFNPNIKAPDSWSNDMTIKCDKPINISVTNTGNTGNPFVNWTGNTGNLGGNSGSSNTNISTFNLPNINIPNVVSNIQNTGGTLIGGIFDNNRKNKGDVGVNYHLIKPIQRMHREKVVGNEYLKGMVFHDCDLTGDDMDYIIDIFPIK